MHLTSSFVQQPLGGPYFAPHGWCDVVRKFGRIFKRAAGTPESLAGEACRRGQNWLCARENPLGLSSV